MGYLATGGIFENMIQLNRFGSHFEGIINDISYRDARGFGGMLPEKILK